ncbi:MAG TPA: bifunctional phosphopantothenoylcysteine decarboxylase/phosphopantothenate--cysteine ligase CoaBC, partial [Usitatibacteraceae bacterium]|nr:bifunctional phosphopantothenoylcysteine decarboxylase/phosphopantothenate--cysteine ligase CoaBC [Usitatibacteraceae bacterium]
QPTCRLLVAPAMNREMWEKPATQRNVARLRADGVHVLGPAEGEQACGETGLGRMLEPGEIADAILRQQVGARRLIGLHAMVTAGPTFEPIDPVRGITNRSSGRMGYAIAKCLIDEGAQVTLVSGPTGLTPPDGAKFVGIETSSQMFEAVNSNLEDVQLFFSVAAVADYTPTSPNQQKMKKAEASLNLKLKPTQDILATVAARRHPPFCVGFAAESENIVEYASKKREKKKIPVIVANHAPSAIGSAENEVTIIDASGIHPVARATKGEIAWKIVDHVVKLYQKTSKTKKKTG